MFGPRAETLSRYPAKGTKVTIEGRLRWSQWEAEDRKRSKIEVVVEGVEFLVHWERGGGDEADRTAMPSTDDEQPTLYDGDARF